ncbi:MAG: arylsulfatase [Planctomycetaceae bacterium]|nr:arylsulfatase [Planctomycetaceae bacterium]
MPNIVFIIADDLGYGDIGAFGQKKIKTPSLDALAGEGIRFTRHYSGNNVCAPSRAVLMTGYHPGHCAVRNNMEVKPEGQCSLPENTATLVGELKKRGYVSGAFGKWGLGSPDSVSTPLRIGFDRFYGYNCQREAHTYYPAQLWNDEQKITVNEHPVPGHAALDPDDDPNDPKSYMKFQGKNYSPDLIAAEIFKFVGKNAEKPFFLYWATTVPHLALQVPEDSLKEYQGLWDDPPFTGIGKNGYTPHFTPRAAYAAMITRFDREIGRLVQLLEDKGVYENTLIVFVSDNGPLYDRLGGTDTEFFNSNAGLRGRKGSMYEGGIRVPCIVSWQGKIRPNRVSDRVTGFEDWMPTLLEIADGKPGTAPDDSDGISFVSTLLAEEDGKIQQDRPFLYRESPGYGGQQTVIAGDWKLVRTQLTLTKRQGKSLADAPVELFNLAEDSFETTNLAKEYPGKVIELENLASGQHVRSTIFPLPLVDN